MNRLDISSLRVGSGTLFRVSFFTGEPGEKTSFFKSMLKVLG